MYGPREPDTGYPEACHGTECPPVVRRLGSIIAALLVAGLLAPALLVAPVAAAARPPSPRS